MRTKRGSYVVALAMIVGLASPALAGKSRGEPEHSIARQWNDALLEAIRNDYARPTVHARNLFHVSIAMWDAWAAYDEVADTYLHHEEATAEDIEAARREAISFATYRIMQVRFEESPGSEETMANIDALMDDLSYDREFTSTVGPTPAALGNRIAETVLTFGLNDNANEQDDYANLHYEPVNPPLLPDFPGNPDIVDPNRWQPLALEFYIDQSGNIIIGGYPDFLSPEWGQVTAFALSDDDLTIYQRDDYDYWVFHDPGAPPQIGGVNDAYYRWGFEQVSIWSSHLDPSDGVMWDISPASIGNAPLADPDDYAAYYNLADGGDWGPGHDVNPATGKPYEPQMVPRGDYARILAEFWADGPDSETPPGHWFVIMNYVADHPSFEKRLGGDGPVLGDLEWDVKAYLAMGGAMHDAAVASWGVKGWYDFIRPISAIRYMCDQGQCTDPDGPSYSPDGINLHPGLVEVVTVETTQPGERHEHLAGQEGKIAVYAWRGHDYVNDPEIDTAGVGWILAESWWPYQRPTFVTPPFAGYVSGHSTYSRAAAEVMTLLTGSAYFPGGMGEFHCPANEFLVFEDGPSIDVTLQWATYRDASDQCSLSRIWGGIHPGADDLPGRWMGLVIGPDAWQLARKYYAGRITCPADLTADAEVNSLDVQALVSAWGECGEGCAADLNEDGSVDVMDLLTVLAEWGGCE
jgi:hypothetical protein